MGKRMLISAAEEGAQRVAILQENVLYDLDIEYVGIQQTQANIYKGRISRVEPSLEAVFVEYSPEHRHGFLPLKEISKAYFLPGTSGDLLNINIKDVVKEGQELLVQVEKEERGNKGAALTTFISLAGSYVVLMPNNPRVGGISRRIEGQERDEMREALRTLRIPEDMGLIIRTAGIGRPPEELQQDVNMLLQLWDAIQKASSQKSAPILIYQESDSAIRAVRDYLREDITSIITDNQNICDKVKNYIALIRPEFAEKVELYTDKIPLFSNYGVEKQIARVYKRVVPLPSGGAIVIDHTEALVSIDVNSAKATGGSDIEETALTTNLEAADEIARQLRLRDIGGLIVIDFIDMDAMRNQREVSQRLREALKHDRARVQVGNITRFGLLEMSRQRIRPYIGEAVQVTCPRCDGQGTIPGIESLASLIIHLLEEEATKEKTGEIHAQLPTNLAAYLLNEKRLAIAQLEEQQNVRVIILPNDHLETPKYKIKNIKKSEGQSGKGGGVKASKSYKLIEHLDTTFPQKQAEQDKSREIPIVSSALGTTPVQEHSRPSYGHGKQIINSAPGGSAKPKKSLLKAIIGKLLGEKEVPEEKHDEKPVQTSQRSGGPRERPRQRYHSNNRNFRRKMPSSRQPGQRAAGQHAAGQHAAGQHAAGQHAAGQRGKQRFRPNEGGSHHDSGSADFSHQMEKRSREMREQRPQHPVSQHPTPQHPVSQHPTPQHPVSQHPTPQYPASHPAQQHTTSQHPAPTGGNNHAGYEIFYAPPKDKEQK